MATLVRTILAMIYLAGTVIHAYNAIANPQLYRPFGESSLTPLSRDLWKSLVMPHIRIWAALLAALELAVGVLLLSKGPLVKVGLAVSILFNLFLVQLGLSAPRTDWRTDLLVNRMPNLITAAIQIPLIKMEFRKSVPEMIGLLR